MAFLQLLSAGTEQQFINDEANISFFKVIYKRHTNFYIDNYVLNGIDTSFSPAHVQFVIPKSGDLLSTTYIQPFQQKNTFQLFGYLKQYKNTLNLNILNFYDTYAITTLNKTDIQNINVVKIISPFITIQSFSVNQKTTNIIKISQNLELEKINNYYNVNEQFKSYSFIDKNLTTTTLYDNLYIKLLFQNISFKNIQYVQFDLKPLQITFQISNVSCNQYKKIFNYFIQNLSGIDNRFLIQTNYLYFYISNLTFSEIIIKYIYDIIPDDITYIENYNKNDTPIRQTLNKNFLKQIFQPKDKIQIFYVSNNVVNNYDSSQYGNLSNQVFNDICVSNYIETVIIFNKLSSLLKLYIQLSNLKINKLGFHKYTSISNMATIMTNNNYVFVHADTKKIELHRFIQKIIISHVKILYFKNNTFDVFDKYVFKMFNRFNVINSNYTLNENENITFQCDTVKISFFLSQALTPKIRNDYEIFKNNLNVQTLSFQNRMERLFTETFIAYPDVEIYKNQNETTTQSIIKSLENLDSFIDYDGILLTSQQLSFKTQAELKLYILTICNKLLYNSIKKTDFMYYELEEKYYFYNLNVINNENVKISKIDVETFLHTQNINDENIVQLFTASINDLMNYITLDTQKDVIKKVYETYFKNIYTFQNFLKIIHLYYDTLQKPSHAKLINYFKRYNVQFNEKLFNQYYDLTKNKITKRYESILNYVDFNEKIIIEETNIQTVKTQIIETIRDLKNIYGGDFNLNSSYTLTQNQLKTIYSSDVFVINGIYVNIFSPYYNLYFDSYTPTQLFYLLYNVAIVIYMFNNFFLYNPIKKLVQSAFVNSNFEYFKTIIYNSSDVNNMIVSSGSSVDNIDNIVNIDLFFNSIIAVQKNENSYFMNEPAFMSNKTTFNLKTLNTLLNKNIYNSKINNVSFMTSSIYSMTSSNMTTYLKSVNVSDNINIVKIIVDKIFENNPLINEAGILQTFDKVELMIGDEIIDTLTQDYYKLFFQTNTNANKYMATREMLGIYGDYININEKYPYIITLNEKRFYIPVIFFLKDRFNALILIASLYDEIKIRVDTNGETVINKFYDPVEVINNKAQFKYSLSLDFILLERDERIKKTKEITDNLIETHAQIDTSKALTEINTSQNDDFIVLQYQFNLKNMVKQVFWRLNFYINDYEFEILNEFIVSFILNIDGLRRDGIVPFNPNKPDAHEILTNSYVKTYPTFTGISQYLTTYRYNIRAPVLKYYSYSFAFEPDLFQPSGAINMSCNEYFGIDVYIDKNKLVNYLQNYGIDSNNFKKVSLKMSLFVHGYNVLRYQSGLSALLYCS